MNRPDLTAPDECKVFTPEPLARAMAKLLPDRQAARWLEPCVGEGVFLRALAEVGVRPERVTALELDRHAGPAGLCGRYLPGTDFLDWALTTDERFDRVIGNPPFLPLHRLPAPIRDAALRTGRPGGGKMPYKANCWYAFLSAILRLLNPGGGVCLVLPSGWEYADYAADVRVLLPRVFAEVEVYRSNVSFFRNVLDGCVVLVADGFGIPNRSLRYQAFATPDELVRALGVREAHPTGKEVTAPVVNAAPLVRFGEVARVRIGAVTGDAHYFLLSEPRRKQLGIPEADVRPVLTRARHLKEATIDVRHWDLLRNSGERVWLFWPAVRPGQRAKGVAKYLQAGIAAGCPDIEKVRARDPWYHTKLPPPPDAFLSGMTHHGPWLCLNRMPSLNATNTLYTVQFLKRLAVGEQAAWALSLISSAVVCQHRKIGRWYSDGLLKFEPKDVMNLLVPRPSTAGGSALQVYRRAVSAMIRGDSATARDLADSFIGIRSR